MRPARVERVRLRRKAQSELELDLATDGQLLAEQIRTLGADARDLGAAAELQCRQRLITAGRTLAAVTQASRDIAALATASAPLFEQQAFLADSAEAQQRKQADLLRSLKTLANAAQDRVSEADGAVELSGDLADMARELRRRASETDRRVPDRGIASAAAVARA